MQPPIPPSQPMHPPPGGSMPDVKKNSFDSNSAPSIQSKPSNWGPPNWQQPPGNFGNWNHGNYGPPGMNNSNPNANWNPSWGPPGPNNNASNSWNQWQNSMPPQPPPSGELIF